MKMALSLIFLILHAACINYNYLNIAKTKHRGDTQGQRKRSCVLSDRQIDYVYDATGTSGKMQCATMLQSIDSPWLNKPYGH